MWRIFDSPTQSLLASWTCAQPKHSSKGDGKGKGTNQTGAHHHAHPYLQQAVIASSDRVHGKFSMLTLDMVRMMQLIEYQLIKLRPVRLLGIDSSHGSRFVLNQVFVAHWCCCLR